MAKPILLTLAVQPTQISDTKGWGFTLQFRIKLLKRNFEVNCNQESKPILIYCNYRAYRP